MQIKFIKQNQNSRELIRRCGYGEHYDARTRLFSYTRRLGTGQYPQFHIYVNEYPDSFVVNLHLDQKKASYEGTHSHAGEYDAEVVNAEAARIKSVIGK